MRRATLISLSTFGALRACSFGYEILPEEPNPSEPPASTRGGAGGDGGAGGAPPASGGDGTGGGDPSCEGWLDETKQHRRALRFDNSAATSSLVDFTVLVVLTPQNFNYANSAPFGADLRFVDASGSTLPHHVDTWNEGSLSSIWVAVPEIAPNDPDLVWLYYGGDEAPAPNPADSFDRDYLAVWHLGEPSGELADSSAAAIGLSSLGGGTGSQGAAGRIGLAAEFLGDGDGATSTGGELDGLRDHTITAWVRPDASGGGDALQAIFSAEEETTAPHPGPGIYYERDTRQVGTRVDGSFELSSTTDNQLLLGEWAFVALRADTSAASGSIELKVNGGDFEQVYSGDATTARVADGNRVQVGTWLGPTEADFTGRIDELQVSRGLRSDDWVEAQYRSQANLGFLTVGSEDTCEN